MVGAEGAGQGPVLKATAALRITLGWYVQAAVKCAAPCGSGARTDEALPAGVDDRHLIIVHAAVGRHRRVSAHARRVLVLRAGACAPAPVVAC